MRETQNIKKSYNLYATLNLLRHNITQVLIRIAVNFIGAVLYLNR